jgi:hypothetical protein
MNSEIESVLEKMRTKTEIRDITMQPGFKLKKEGE